MRGTNDDEESCAWWHQCLGSSGSEMDHLFGCWKREQQHGQQIPLRLMIGDHERAQLDDWKGNKSGVQEHLENRQDFASVSLADTTRLFFRE